MSIIEKDEGHNDRNVITQQLQETDWMFIWSNKIINEQVIIQDNLRKSNTTTHTNVIILFYI